MNTLSKTGTPFADRIKLKVHYDAARMHSEIEQLQLQDFIHYSVLPLTFPSPKANLPENVDYADGSWANWNDSSELLACPYIYDLVKSYRQHCEVTLVRILRLEAGGIIKEHTDPTLGLHIEKSVIRLTIPIVSDEGVIFYLNRTPVPMKVGECWYLNLTDPHQIENHSQRVRINMSIDMRPNDWLLSLIEGEV